MQSTRMLRVVDDAIESPNESVPDIFSYSCERFCNTIWKPLWGLLCDVIWATPE